MEIGSVVKGTVQNVVDFGVFVDIGLKTSGLIHRSELSNSRFHHPLDVISVGDVIEPVIISIDEQRNRIGLSLKQAKKLPSKYNLNRRLKRRLFFIVTNYIFIIILINIKICILLFL